MAAIVITTDWLCSKGLCSSKYDSWIASEHGGRLVLDRAVLLRLASMWPESTAWLARQFLDGADLERYAETCLAALHALAPFAESMPPIEGYRAICEANNASLRTATAPIIAERNRRWAEATSQAERDAAGEAYRLANNTIHAEHAARLESAIAPWAPHLKAQGKMESAIPPHLLADTYANILADALGL